MKIAFIMFDDITWLDFIGFYDPLIRLVSLGFKRDIEWKTCSFDKDLVSDSFGIKLQVDYVGQSLSEFDAVFIPGGFGTRELIKNENFLNWIKTIKPNALKLSVCTGSLILGAVGF